jgi:hypothetical protein
MKIPFLFLIPAVLLVSGCSIINMAAGPADYERNHAADVLKISIDSSILTELRKEPPSGYRTKPYSRGLWQEYWNGRIAVLWDFHPEEHYRGPSGEEFAAYIIHQRKAVGLPPIVLTPENRKKMKAIRITPEG